jgi:hypothetical protein
LIEEKLKVFKLIENFIEPEEYDLLKTQFEKEFGAKRSDNDTIWMIFNNHLLRYIDPNDWQRLSSIYRNMYLFMKMEGRDGYGLLKKSYLVDLKKNKEWGFKLVKAYFNNPVCKACTPLNEKIFKIDELIDSDTIPNKNCENKYCDCFFESVTDYEVNG